MSIFEELQVAYRASQETYREYAATASRGTPTRA